MCDDPGDRKTSCGRLSLAVQTPRGHDLKIGKRLLSQVFQSQMILQTIRSLKKSQKMLSLKNPKMERSFERSFYRENIV